MEWVTVAGENPVPSRENEIIVKGDCSVNISGNPSCVTITCNCPKWISVKNRLPEMKEKGDILSSADVLAFDGECTFVACHWKFKHQDEEYFKSTICDCCCPMEEITHWMPLPEPPKVI